LIAEDPASPQGKCKLHLGEASGKDSSISLFGRLSLVYGLDPSRHPLKSARQCANGRSHLVFVHPGEELKNAEEIADIIAIFGQESP